MRLGISASFPHSSPEEWARLHREAGLGAVVFPLSWKAETSEIDRYRDAARGEDLLIAEVGAWCNPMDPDPEKRKQNRLHCTRQLELAEYVGAVCCVNISGADGELWDGSYAGNYSEAYYEENVRFLQDMLDEVKPKRAKYALEPMPHTIPDSPADYARIVKDVDRAALGVHVDVVNLLVSPRVFYHNRALIEEMFTLLGDRICSCHLKDAVLDHSLTVSIRETECGKGGVDLAYYVESANRVSPDIPMIIEHLPDLESYRRGIAYIRKLTGETGETRLSPK